MKNTFIRQLLFKRNLVFFIFDGKLYYIQIFKGEIIMTNTYLRKKMIFIIEQSLKTLIKVQKFHKKNDLFKRDDIDPKFFTYILALLTTLNILEDKIESLLKKINSFNKKADLPIKDTQIAKLELVRQKIRCAKDIEKRFL